MKKLCILITSIVLCLLLVASACAFSLGDVVDIGLGTLGSSENDASTPGNIDDLNKNALELMEKVAFSTMVYELAARTAYAGAHVPGIEKASTLQKEKEYLTKDGKNIKKLRKKTKNLNKSADNMINDANGKKLAQAKMKKEEAQALVNEANTYVRMAALLNVAAIPDGIKLLNDAKDSLVLLQQNPVENLSMINTITSMITALEFVNKELPKQDKKRKIFKSQLDKFAKLNGVKDCTSDKEVKKQLAKLKKE